MDFAVRFHGDFYDCSNNQAVLAKHGFLFPKFVQSGRGGLINYVTPDYD